MENSTSATDATNTTDTADDTTSELTNTTEADDITSDITNTTNTTTDVPSDVCQDELESANACVSQSPDECSCIPNLDSFMTSFPDALDSSFQDAMNNAGEQDASTVCKDAEKSVCE